MSTKTRMALTLFDRLSYWKTIASGRALGVTIPTGMRVMRISSTAGRLQYLVKGDGGFHWEGTANSAWHASVQGMELIHLRCLACGGAATGETVEHALAVIVRMSKGLTAEWLGEGLGIWATGGTGWYTGESIQRCRMAGTANRLTPCESAAMKPWAA